VGGRAMKLNFELNVSREKENFVIKALEQLSGPQRGWRFNTYSNGIQEIIWFDLAEGLSPEPLENILSLVDELHAEWQLTKYKSLRSKEYPSIGDQLDNLYRYFTEIGVENDFTRSIKQVKDKYPKPE
jgi:hypothetical protein